MRTTRIVSGLSVAAKRNGTSTAAMLSTLSAPLVNRNVQPQEPYFNTKQEISLEAFKFTLPTVNTDIRDIENVQKYANENNPNPPVTSGRHSPTRITDHDKFKFDFRTFQERERSAQAKASAPTRSAQLRA